MLSTTIVSVYQTRLIPLIPILANVWQRQSTPWMVQQSITEPHSHSYLLTKEPFLEKAWRKPTHAQVELANPSFNSNRGLFAEWPVCYHYITVKHLDRHMLETTNTADVNAGILGILGCPTSIHPSIFFTSFIPFAVMWLLESIPAIVAKK